MELRELVLSTLCEIDEKIEQKKELIDESDKNKSDLNESKNDSFKMTNIHRSDDEIAFLKHTKERLEVLFEGLKSDEIDSYEQKLEITLKYLQLLLSQVDQRLASKS